MTMRIVQCWYGTETSRSPRDILQVTCAMLQCCCNSSTMQSYDSQHHRHCRTCPDYLYHSPSVVVVVDVEMKTFYPYCDYHHHHHHCCWTRTRQHDSSQSTL